MENIHEIIFLYYIIMACVGKENQYYICDSEKECQDEIELLKQHIEQNPNDTDALCILQNLEKQRWEYGKSYRVPPSKTGGKSKKSLKNKSRKSRKARKSRRSKK
jgi:hypothetical protein